MIFRDGLANPRLSDCSIVQPESDHIVTSARFENKQHYISPKLYNDSCSLLETRKPSSQNHVIIRNSRWTIARCYICYQSSMMSCWQHVHEISNCAETCLANCHIPCVGCGCDYASHALSFPWTLTFSIAWPFPLWPWQVARNTYSKVSTHLMRKHPSSLCSAPIWKAEFYKKQSGTCTRLEGIFACVLGVWNQ